MNASITIDILTVSVVILSAIVTILLGYIHNTRVDMSFYKERYLLLDIKYSNCHDVLRTRDQMINCLCQILRLSSSDAIVIALSRAIACTTEDE